MSGLNKLASRITRTKSFSLQENEWFNRYKSLAVHSQRHVLLESGRGGRFSMMGLDPFAVIEGHNQTLTLTIGSDTQVWNGPLLKSVELAMEPLMIEEAGEATGAIPFKGGAIGYFSYDVVREIEQLPSKAEEDLPLPHVYLMLFEDVFVYDHQTELMHVSVNGSMDEEESLLERLEKYHAEWLKDSVQTEWKNKQADSTSNAGKKNHVSMTEEEFVHAVNKIQSYIAEGDVFQVNLSLRESKPLTVEPLHVYEKLREFNPSPYMSYLQTPDFQLVSASPELLVKKQGNRLSTRPIAGTRSRGATEEEDQQLADSLFANEKERAEHVMLVDLERNDLGRVSSYGSVEVDELMVIERYSHVMHLVSNVIGELAEGNSVHDVIRAVFPGGTITGAPKVRTMEIIEELERVRRGIYTGAIGWIGYHGDMELNITIRTMICYDELAHVQAGAGIVIDSNPYQEYKESFKKARALWRALELSEDECKTETQTS
ncbi:aminodeoxychorismate synthase, component I [Alkalicoccobacillus murimartini]|uniref:Para-aminobenzoate synthetase component 1 n=1 Tax=Alkalicoccobacillus murimartini TaxID=171685 RepID=A0ABT9YN09_9BACI|nr:aminodeoxychorismate synthase, component I [Alkalicoccobacillus murimartini]MDQ0209228.1 para-aminobenzoate synthetase component 1 [Alkalicoccobacillus murimartini]